MITPPICQMHNKQMVLHVYDRPGSPPGNGWVCRTCVAERNLLQLDSPVQVTRSYLKTQEAWQIWCKSKKAETFGATECEHQTPRYSCVTCRKAFEQALQREVPPYDNRFSQSQIIRDIGEPNEAFKMTPFNNCGCPHPTSEHTSCAAGPYCSHDDCRCVDGHYFGKMDDPQSLVRAHQRLQDEGRAGQKYLSHDWHEGANWMLNAIIGSLKGYPGAGGDSSVMMEIERIVKESYVRPVFNHHMAKRVLVEAVKPSHVPMLMSGWPENQIDIHRLATAINEITLENDPIRKAIKRCVDILNTPRSNERVAEVRKLLSEVL